MRKLYALIRNDYCFFFLLAFNAHDAQYTKDFFLPSDKYFNWVCDFVQCWLHFFLVWAGKLRNYQSGKYHCNKNYKSTMSPVNNTKHIPFTTSLWEPMNWIVFLAILFINILRIFIWLDVVLIVILSFFTPRISIFGPYIALIKLGSFHSQPLVPHSPSLALSCSISGSVCIRFVDSSLTINTF